MIYSPAFRRRNCLAGDLAQKRLIVQQLRDALFGIDAAVHEAEQFLELTPHLEDLGQLRNLRGDLVRREIAHLGEGEIERQFLVALLAFDLRQRVLHACLHAGPERFHEFGEAVGVGLDEGAVEHRLRGFLGLRGAGKVGHHAHDKRQFDRRRAAVGFHVVGDLHPRRAISFDDLRFAFGWHVLLPFILLSGLLGVGNAGQEPEFLQPRRGEIFHQFNKIHVHHAAHAAGQMRDRARRFGAVVEGDHEVEAFHDVVARGDPVRQASAAGLRVACHTCHRIGSMTVSSRHCRFGRRRGRLCRAIRSGPGGRVAFERRQQTLQIPL
ncbi:hypothetical protein AJ88_26935 [Mesorhizobium amorphae CCBAU 01583]|nr:hypothetical protein AJ88_26935 [Mesorhizobium amorphae CCBAU 01583]